ncbi:MAG: LicD family protein [Coriobacteriales bacterium]|nr:LicD family protein [Coriobacteriales bacterium]
MGFLAKLKQFLPPSSRSFHAMYREMVESNWIVKDTGLKLYDMDYQFNARLDRLERQIATHDTHLKMLAWANYRRAGESLDDAKRRFFHDLPQATGASRLLQLATLQLLSEFDALCKEHHLDYWASCGTVLGAVRHGGFVPWDDDIDLGMFREDLLKLIAAVEESERYRVTVIYDRWFMCRQVRFRYLDDSLPCFLDLFIYDYTKTADVELVERRHFEMRDRLEAEATSSPAVAHWTHDNASISADDEQARPIRELFDRYLAEQQSGEGLMLPTAKGAQGMAWAVDNMEDRCGRRWRVCSLDEAFPMTSLDFEGRQIPVLRNYEVFLDELYGDYLSLPDDINGHDIVHLDEGVLDAPETLSALEHLVSGAGE